MATDAEPRKPLVLTPQRLAANRANAKKAGRPVGRKSQSTLVREEARRQLEALITGKIGALFALQFKIAEMAETNPGAANSAIESMLERALGRPTAQEPPAEVRPPVTIVNVFAPETAPQAVTGHVVPSQLPARRD